MTGFQHNILPLHNNKSQRCFQLSMVFHRHDQTRNVAASLYMILRLTWLFDQHNEQIPRTKIGCRSMCFFFLLKHQSPVLTVEMMLAITSDEMRYQLVPPWLSTFSHSKWLIRRVNNCCSTNLTNSPHLHEKKKMDGKRLHLKGPTIEMKHVV